MKIMKMPSMGMFAVNCYMVVSDAGNAALIDAPCGGEAILRAIEESGAKLQKILLTHGHCDHIESLALIAERTGAQVYIHSADEVKLHDDYLNLSEYFADYCRKNSEMGIFIDQMPNIFYNRNRYPNRKEDKA